MDKFTRTLRGYDPVEVNKFLDQVIVQVEKMNNALKEKDAIIEKLKKSGGSNIENIELKEKLKRYESMENTLNRAIIMAEKTSEQIKINAIKERDLILDNAKNNANRIVNDALLKAESTERDAFMLKRNINVYKRRLKDIIEEQLRMIDEIDKIEL